MEEKPWHGEDFNEFWGFVDFQNKVILDIGADYGSTAYFFLQQGAAHIVCVECYKNHAMPLLDYAEREPRVEAFMKRISQAQDYVELLQKYQFDLAKVDGEGCEAYLLDVEDKLFSTVPEYVIELHNASQSERARNLHRFGNDLGKPFREKFERCGYTVTAPIYRVLWAKKSAS